MKATGFRLLLVALLCVAWVVGCGPASAPTVPEATGDGWQVGALAEVGLDPGPIAEAVARIEDGDYANVHSLLIVKDGKLVFEDYFPGYAWDYDDEEFQGERIDFDRDTLHNLASVTKSFTSALVGMAIEQGAIEGVDHPVFDLYPEYAALSDEVKATMTVEDLLTMRSGLACNEMELPYSDLQNDLVQLFLVEDPVNYILSKPLVAEPGTQWYYSGGNTCLLGEAIRRTTGQRMDVYGAERLFAPLGIVDYEWDYINPDFVHASGNLRLRPRDMAKFGQLYLDGGEWQGERIVPEAWVEASTQWYVTVPGGDGYGYQWWLRTFDAGREAYDAFYAAGWGGQTIIVFPEVEMVVVTTGGNYVGDSPVDEIVSDHVLAALR